MPWNTPDDVNECPICGELYYGSFPACDCDDEGVLEDE